MENHGTEYANAVEYGFYIKIPYSRWIHNHPGYWHFHPGISGASESWHYHGPQRHIHRIRRWLSLQHLGTSYVSMGPGGVGTLVRYLYVPCNIRNIPILTGNYEFWVKADHQGLLRESNEENNEIIFPSKVSITRGAGCPNPT